MTPRICAALVAATALTAPLAAENSALPMSPQSRAASDTRGVSSPGNLALFTPASERREHRIDYAHWDEALGWMVIPMGPSLRQGAPRVDPRTGTRRIYGHESRFRLEGNRVAFSYLTPEIRASLKEYREDLERIGTELDITTLPRNEQLAYWLNLHNVAVIEVLAGRYPITEVTDDTDIHNTKLVTVSGVALSPGEIRQIVYSNWSDPKVIYGFWHGTIGGPSIQRLAYSGANVDALLSLSAEEFVNSLRGVEKAFGTMRVSPLYREAGNYFPDDDALLAHFAAYARDDTQRLLADPPRRIMFASWESDIADLSRGERDPSLGQLCVGAGGVVEGGGGGAQASTASCTTARFTPNPAIQRLLEERAEKLDRARRAGVRSGMVIYGDGGYSDAGPPPEVE